MGFVRPALESLGVGFYTGGMKGNFSPAFLPDSLPSKVKPLVPDIIHLHWVANAMMRVETCRRFNRPLVWTLHDSWAFTGGCHVPFDCTRYREACGECPALGSARALDLSHWLWLRKQRSWGGLNLTVVTPSNWLAHSARTSSLFKDIRIEVIPNGLDLVRYKPIDRRIARELLSLPQEKKLILFGGKSGTSDRNKGFHLFAKALQEVAFREWRDTAEVVVFGSLEPVQPPDLGLKTRYLGWLNDDVSLALLYAAADVFVFPSIQEVLGYAAMESMACGTPCVAFNQGGVSDLIDHEHNGYLARPYEPASLAHGILWVLGDESRRRELSFQARQKVERDFALENVAGRYVELYRDICSGREKQQRLRAEREK